MKMKKRFWTEAEIEILRARYPHELTTKIATDLGRDDKSLWTKANALGLKKTAEFLRSEESGCIRKGEHRGTATQFRPGQRSWNKGKKGLRFAGSEKGHFKKGDRPVNYRPVGSTRINVDGYIEIKTSDTPKWELLHRVVWEKQNGKISSGFQIRFIDGDSQNCTIENLTLISREEHMRMNTIHRYPEEIKNTIRTLGVLRRKINAATK